VVGDLLEEFRGRASRDGTWAARAWLWRQVLGSVPPLARRTLSRGFTGFEPASSGLRTGGPWMESLIIDLLYAARRLRTRPMYALLSVLTLALGVGGVAAAFGLVRGLLLSPLPVANEAELGLFWQGGDWSEREFLRLSPEWPGFSGVAAYARQDFPLRTAPDAPPRLVAAVRTSAGLLDVLGVHPILGRGFERGEDRPGAAPAVVLSDGLFHELGGQPSLVGRTIDLDGKPYRAIGVMGPGFWFPDTKVRAWVAEPFNEEDASGNYTLVARRAPGTEGPALAAALRGISTRLGESFKYPAAWDKTRAPAFTPLREALLAPLRAPLFATLAAMALLLLIACANVAALMLGQVDARATELAVRIALGADAFRLRQQLVVEALLVGLGAAAAGAAIAAYGHDLLRRALPLGALAASAGLDWGIFFGALVLALLAALAVASLPARSLRKADPQGALSTSRTAGIGARGGLTESALVIGQVAVAVLLTAGAALLVRSVANLRGIDPGIDTSRVAVLDVVFEGTVSAASRPRLLTDLEAALARLPGADAAGATLKLPLRGSGQSWGVRVEDKPDLPVTTTFFRLVTPGYFETMGFRLVAGRFLTPDDGENAERVVVVNRALAAKYFPGEDPIGKRLATVGRSWERIVGVVENVAEADLTDAPAPARYMAYAQMGSVTGTSHSLVVRAKRGQDPAALVATARKAIAATSSSVAVEKTTTLDAVLLQAIGPARQVMSVLTLLTTLALLLGAVGIYGVTAHSVRRRQRDMGIRIALGLRPAKLLFQVIRRGAGLVAAGAGLGTVAAVALARLMSAFLYGVRAVDPMSLAFAALALLAIGVTAALVPAWRASRLDPATVLREG